MFITNMEQNRKKKKSHGTDLSVWVTSLVPGRLLNQDEKGADNGNNNNSKYLLTLYWLRHIQVLDMCGLI